MVSKQRWTEAHELANEYYDVQDAELQKLLELADTKSSELVAAAAKRQSEETKREARKRGVLIGMTKEEVLGSSWGRPERVNSTHRANSTTEQWVYPGGNYLYFRNGVLDSIQTRR